VSTGVPRALRLDWSPSHAPGLASYALLLAGLAACDTGAPSPARSRVQDAVLAQPESAAAAGAASVTPTSEPAAKKPHIPLCEGQLGDKPQPFKPKRQPTRVSVQGAPELAQAPVSSARQRWTWINLWAAWCVPCKEELPMLLGWQQRLSGRLDFAFISLDDDERQLRDFLEHQPNDGLRSTYWLPDGEIRRAWLDTLNAKTEPGLPLQLFIDPSGMLRCRVEGAVDPKDFGVLERIVQD
jgi:thiol-disulfide isomerase/thioredoxin